MDDILLVTLCDGWHPQYGSHTITDFIPSPPEVFARIAYLQEHGDSHSELPALQQLLTKMARLICRDMAITFALAADRADMEEDARRLADLCLPPAQPTPEAFPVWLRLARLGAEMELHAVQSADLAPDVKQVVADLIQRRLHVAQQQAANERELAMQVVAVWWMHEELMRTAGIVLDAVGLQVGNQQAKERAQQLHPLDVDYTVALTAVRGIPLEKFRAEFRRVLAKQERLNQNPSGTGKNPEYEHEVAESQLDTPEPSPSPLEVAVSREPDPAEVVADRDAVERLLSQFGKRTAELLRLMLEGKSIAEAARELGISPATARKLVERARKQFSPRA